MSGVDSGLWHGPWQIAEVEFLNGCLHPESVEGAARRNRYKAAAQIHKIVARTEITRAHSHGFIKGVEAERERVLGMCTECKGGGEVAPFGTSGYPTPSICTGCGGSGKR